MVINQEVALKYNLQCEKVTIYVVKFQRIFIAHLQNARSL